MADLFANGFVIDVILALVLIEALAIAILHRFNRRLPSLSTLGPNLAAGFSLLLAVRAAITQAHWLAVAALLAAALVAHLFDLAGRRPDQ